MMSLMSLKKAFLSSLVLLSKFPTLLLSTILISFDFTLNSDQEYAIWLALFVVSDH